MAGRHMLHSKPVRPEPLNKPKHTEHIAEEAEDIPPEDRASRSD